MFKNLFSSESGNRKYMITGVIAVVVAVVAVTIIVVLSLNQADNRLNRKAYILSSSLRGYLTEQGEAEKVIREAEGYQLDKINRAKGEAERFLDTWAEYKKAPQITQKRLYLDTMMEVLPEAKEKYIIDPSQSSILPLLNIGRKGGAEQ